MDIARLIEEYGTEDKCIEALAELRWPNGVTCPKCESTEIGTIATRKLFQCNGCDYQFSVRVGTVLQNSKLPLWKWFLATFLIIQSKKGISSAQLSRMVGVTTKTGWYLTHRIRAAMVDDDTLLGNTVEMDETYVGGKVRGKGRNYTGNKALILGAVERGGSVKLGIGVSRDGAAFSKFIRENVEDTVKFVYTDDLRAYTAVPELRDEDTTHHTVNHSADEWVRGDVHTNTIEGVWSLLKRSIIGSYHHLSIKHLPAYLDELEWRYNNRKNPYLFRDTLIRLCESEVLGYRELTAA
ncbi:MAG TPA: IS1595 family transposase [Acidimicrobiia bacterium]|nr:IS1595 family transposase [Acidimicrobiia bacterium]